MPTPSPIFGWDLPTLGETADAPAAFAALVNDIEATLTAPGITTYLPSWTSDGTIQPVNAATKTGIYRIDRKVCWFQVQMTYGASSGGGQGPIRVGLPATARTGQGVQYVACRLNIPGGLLFNGLAEIRDGENTCLPCFPVGASQSNVGYWQSAANTSTPTPDTGVPTMTDGQHNVRNGGSFGVSGYFFTA